MQKDVSEGDVFEGKENHIMKKQRRTKNSLLAALLLCMMGTLVLWAADDAKVKLTDAAGVSTFAVQNNVPATVMSVDSLGDIRWKSGTSFDGQFAHAITAARTWTFPDASGTVAVSATSPVTLSAAGDVGLGTVPIANGGTGQITANAGFNALAPAQVGNTGKFLQTDATNTSWASALPQNVQYYTDVVSDTLAAGQAVLWDGGAATITPVSVTNRVLVQGVIQVSSNAATASVQTFRVWRGAACAGTQVGFDLLNYTAAVNTEERVITFTFVDAPATVAAQQYTICGLRSAGTIVTPRISLTLMEIGP